MENNLDWVDELYNTYKDKWLKNKEFRKAAWTVGDHEHCLFDGKRISNYDNDDNDKQGYVSTTGWVWLCTDCFEALKQKGYNLPLTKNSVNMVKEALNEHKTVVISLNNEQYFINNNGKIIVEHNGSTKEYDSINAMEREQMFFGKPIREAIEEIYLGIIN